MTAQEEINLIEEDQAAERRKQKALSIVALTPEEEISLDQHL